MGQVYELDLDHSKQSIMLAMADHANDQGGSVYPGLEYVAWKTGYSKRQVQRIITNLEEIGLLIPVAYPNGGRGHATEYVIDISKGTPKPAYVNVDILSDETVNVDTIVSPQPPINVSTYTDYKDVSSSFEEGEYEGEKLSDGRILIRETGEILPSRRANREETIEMLQLLAYWDDLRLGYISQNARGHLKKLLKQYGLEWSKKGLDDAVQNNVKWPASWALSAVSGLQRSEGKRSSPTRTAGKYDHLIRR